MTSRSIFDLDADSLDTLLAGHGLHSDNHSAVQVLLKHLFDTECFSGASHDNSHCSVISRWLVGPSTFLFCLLTSIQNTVWSDSVVDHFMRCMRHCIYFNVDGNLAWLDMLSACISCIMDRLSSSTLVHAVDNLLRADLREACYTHSVRFRNSDFEQSRCDLVSHLVNNVCDVRLNGTCELLKEQDIVLSRLVLFYRDLKKLRFRSITICRLLKAMGVTISANDRLPTMHRTLWDRCNKFLNDNRSAINRINSDMYRETRSVYNFTGREDYIRSWPQILSDDDKDGLVRKFRDATSSTALRKQSCAVCSEMHYSRDIHTRLLRSDEEQLGVLRKPYPIAVLNPFRGDDALDGLMLDPDGVVRDVNGLSYLRCCKYCYVSMYKRNRMPKFALANDLFLGPVPDELRDLTIMEETMLGMRRAKVFIIHLNDVHEKKSAKHQRGLKGHIIIHPSYPEKLGSKLPLPLEDVVRHVCVLFVGSTPPTKEWLMTYAKPLLIRPDKLRAALVRLKKDNLCFNGIEIDHAMLDGMPSEFIAPVRIEASQLSGFPFSRTTTIFESETQHDRSTTKESLFETVVVTDVDGRDMTTDQMAAAALQHLRSGKPYIEMKHGSIPTNDYDDPMLYALMFPTLFPYGIGSPDNTPRCPKLSLRSHVKHLFRLRDRRFQEHNSFLFIVFNIMQRHSVNLSASLMIRRPRFSQFSQELLTVSPSAISRVSARLEKGGPLYSTDPDERVVTKLMQQVTLINRKIPGTSASKMAMRNELRALIMTHGLPSFYITINPADIKSPIVRFMFGHEVDIDNLTNRFDAWQQSCDVSRNPFVPAEFFNVYIKAFLQHLLGSREDPRLNTIGIVNLLKALYSVVEAQNKGTLHCHMLIWVFGGLDPMEIKRRILEYNDFEFETRLIKFLDDTLRTDVPTDPSDTVFVPSSIHKASTVRGPDPDDELYKIKKDRDLHFLVPECQTHIHTSSCYKYSKTECRYKLDPKNYVPATVIDRVTGEITYRVANGMINTYNPTILSAVRCNMDMKFIGSGPAAQAIVHYVTDYVTKFDLKSHVAYATLQMAVSKIVDTAVLTDDISLSVRRLLVKCSNALIAKQELSAQQVASFIMGYEDHFTDHKFRSFYWKSFESYLENNMSFEPNTRVRTQSKHSLSDDTESNFSDGSCDEIESREQEACDDVFLSFNGNGDVVCKANQLMDYVYRPLVFSSMCVWDYISRVDKISIASDSTRIFRLDDDGSAACDDQYSSHRESTYVLAAGNNSEDTRRTGRKCNPRGLFTVEHPEHLTHAARLRGNGHKYVPVPTGPKIYRRDRPEVYWKYCRLMLLLFKPWRTVNDLYGSELTWEDAFVVFKQEACDDIIRVMDNMQVLHECKDSRDDHFRNRRAHGVMYPTTQRGLNIVEGGDEIHGTTDEDDLLANLQRIEVMNTKRSLAENRESSIVLNIMRRSGFFTDEQLFVGGQRDPSDTVENVEVTDNDMSLETEWRRTYEIRRESWKQQLLASVVDQRRSNAEFVSAPGDMVRETCIDDCENLNSVSLRRLDKPVDDIRSHIEDTEHSIDSIVSLFDLNAEQAFAFSLVAKHSIDSGCAPLSLFIGGAGGTGKSRVIQAIVAWFRAIGDSSRLRVASYTGSAANNVQGMTIHGALNLSPSMNTNLTGKTKKDLSSMWRKVDYFVIDEVSMLSCEFLADISDILSTAKQSVDPYGGVSVIFCGDFRQLAPVGGTSLLSRQTKLDTVTQSQTRKGQRTLAGRMLWLNVHETVLLRQQMRQVWSANTDFRSLLLRISEGAATESDYEVLQSREMERVMSHTELSAWFDQPIITRHNSVKDLLNLYATLSFASRHNKRVHLYYADDFRSGDLVGDGDLQEYLYSLHTGKTKYMGVLPLTPGMRVQFLHNYDVQGGVVNGCEGILKSVRFTMDSHGRRHATSCVVLVESSSCQSMPHLIEHEVVALRESVDFIIRNPKTKKSVKFVRKQLPIVPAYAMTDFKAQGKTYDRATVDIESCINHQSVYVMLSRVKSLDGLLILRPFNRKHLFSHQSQDVRSEFKRQEYCNARTALRHSSGSASNNDIKTYLQLQYDLSAQIIHERSSIDTFLRQRTGSV